MKNLVFSAVAMVSLVLGAGAALSSTTGIAELSAVQGKVLVNQGKGFEAVVGSVVLNAGDKVMVGDKSSAEINYLAANCKVTAAASSVATISDVAPCKAGEVVGMADSVFVLPTADIGTIAEPAPFPIFPVLLGGAVVVGVAVLVLDNNHHDHGVSAP